MIVLLASLLTLVGCNSGPARMAQPESPEGVFRNHIAAARKLLEQNENWCSRAEWEVLPSGAGWRVIAWRVEHPQMSGPDRYLPWGYSVIELDSRLTPVSYRRKG